MLEELYAIRVPADVPNACFECLRQAAVPKAIGNQRFARRWRGATWNIGPDGQWRLLDIDFETEDGGVIHVDFEPGTIGRNDNDDEPWQLLRVFPCPLENSEPGPKKILEPGPAESLASVNSVECALTPPAYCVTREALSPPGGGGDFGASPPRKIEGGAQ